MIILGLDIQTELMMKKAHFLKNSLFLFISFIFFGCSDNSNNGQIISDQNISKIIELDSTFFIEWEGIRIERRIKEDFSNSEDSDREISNELISRYNLRPNEPKGVKSFLDTVWNVGDVDCVLVNQICLAGGTCNELWLYKTIDDSLITQKKIGYRYGDAGGEKYAFPTILSNDSILVKKIEIEYDENYDTLSLFSETHIIQLSVDTI